MSDAPPDGLGTYVLVSGLVFALLVAATAVAALAMRGNAFRKRLKAYGTLPFARELATMQSCVARASQRVAAAPTLVARGQGALGEIDRAQVSLRASGGAVVDVARAMFARD